MTHKLLNELLAVSAGKFILQLWDTWVAYVLQFFCPSVPDRETFRNFHWEPSLVECRGQVMQSQKECAVSNSQNSQTRETISKQYESSDLSLYLVMSCLVLSCLALPCRVVFFFLVLFFPYPKVAKRLIDCSFFSFLGLARFLASLHD